jgi:hypothetical protein
MLTTKTYDLPMTVVVTQSDNDHLEINRLLAAAVINKSFCSLLLDNPELALAEGFQGETFPLSAEERALVLSIRAGNLTDLARQLVQTFGEPTVKDPQPHALYLDHFR